MLIFVSSKKKKKKKKKKREQKRKIANLCLDTLTRLSSYYKPRELFI